MALSAYAFFSVLGYSAGLLTFAILAHRANRPPSQIIFLGAIAATSSLFGAKIFHVLFEARGHALPDGSVAESVSDLLTADPWHWARLFDPGHVFYGGVIVAGIATWAALAWARIERPLQYADFFAVSLALGLSIGRVGCYFAGCCFGDTAIPLQLVESAFALGCFAWLIFAQHGDPFLFFITSYSLFRFTIEFFRADADRGLWLNDTLSTSQIVSLLLLTGLVFWRFMRSDRVLRSKLG